MADAEFTTCSDAGRAFSSHGIQAAWQVHRHVFALDASFSM